LRVFTAGKALECLAFRPGDAGAATGAQGAPPV